MIIKHKNTRNRVEADIHIDANLKEVLSGYTISITKTGYILCQKKKSRERYLLHHLVLPKIKGLVVDHINHDGFDNRLKNLRYATHSQNLNNRKKPAGVCSYSNSPNYKWQAYIQTQGKHCWLGCFKTKKEAFMARKNAENSINYPTVNFNGKMNTI